MNSKFTADILLSMPVGALLRRYASAAMLAMSANGVFNLLNILVISRGVGLDATAGLAVTFPIVTFISALASLTNAGSSMQLSMLMANNDQAKALKVFGNSLVLSITMATIFAIVAELLLDDILRLCGASERTLPYAHDYMRVMLVGMFLLCSMQGMGRLLHVIGNPKIQMIQQLGGLSINLIVDCILVFVFHLGMRGVAIGSVVCQCLAWCVFLRVLTNKKMFVHFSWSGFIPDKEIIKDILSAGVAPFATNACGCVVALMINLSLIDVGGENGDLYMSTYAIIQRITQVLILLIVGLGQGMQPIVSFNIMRQSYLRVRKLLMLTIFIASIIMSVGYLIVAAFTEQIVTVFTTDQPMIDICIPALTIGMCTFPFVGGQMVAVSFFSAIRRSRISMIISLTRQVLFLIPMLVFLPHIIGVTGVWWSMALADVASVTITWAMLYTETKKLSL